MELSPTTILLLVGLLFGVLLMLRVPVAIALCGSSLAGVVVVRGLDSSLAAFGAVPYHAISSPTLSIIPLFIAMGVFAIHADLAERALASAQKLLGRLPGGLGVATLMGSGLFASITGSSVACVGAMAKVATDSMMRFGYPLRYAAGTVGAGGTLGVLIPPSITLVLYGLVAEESIGAMLLAGLLPGLLSLGMFCITAVVYAMYLRRRGPAARTSHERVVAANDRKVAGGATSASTNQPAGGAFEGRVHWGALLQFAGLFSVSVGTIYLGVATPTEAASLGMIGAAILLVYRNFQFKRRLWSQVGSSLYEAASITSMLFFLMLGGALFTYFLALSGSAQDLVRAVVNSNLSPTAILLIGLAVIIPLGMFIDGLSIVLIVTPLLHPVVTAFGVDGIWLGILIVKLAEIGLLSPPVGLNAYVFRGAVRQGSLAEVFRGFGPFIATDFVTFGLLFAFPAISLAIPHSAGLGLS